MEFVGKITALYPTVGEATIRFMFGRTHVNFQVPIADFDPGDTVTISITKNESVSEKSQGELEPLPGAKWDGGSVGQLLKHGRE